ncbi:MAG TPA: type II toxin-antitoxin system VapB family antitoxin [Steroidobacteraceae bacterium]|nr:type II toxin-antitoxin system VapB family antitoxin [Steroidobacteraceae bacterium]
MGAQLNIKSDEAYRLASRLAKLTGKSLTTVVTDALRENVERAERERDKATKIERVLALAADLRAHMTPPFSSSDPDEFYDHDGLPK